MILDILNLKIIWLAIYGNWTIRANAFSSEHIFFFDHFSEYIFDHSSEYLFRTDIK